MGDKDKLRLLYRTEDDLEMEFQLRPQIISKKGNAFDAGHYSDFIAFCNYTEEKRRHKKKNSAVEDILIPEYEKWLENGSDKNIFDGLFCNVELFSRQRKDSSGELPCHWEFPRVIVSGERKYLSKPILNILVGNSTLVESSRTREELDLRNLRRIVIDEVDELVIPDVNPSKTKQDDAKRKQDDAKGKQDDYSNLKSLFTLGNEYPEKNLKVNWNQCRSLLYSATLMEQVEEDQRKFTDELYNAKEIRKEQ